MKLKINIYTLLTIVFILFFASCNKDPIAAYPKNVTIKYEVSSSINNATADITYTNDSGGDSNFDNQTLPYSKTLSKSVAFAEIISLSASSLNADDLIMKLYVNNNVVESKTFESSSFNVGVLIYQFD